MEPFAGATSKDVLRCCLRRRCGEAEAGYADARRHNAGPRPTRGDASALRSLRGKPTAPAARLAAAGLPERPGRHSLERPDPRRRLRLVLPWAPAPSPTARAPASPGGASKAAITPAGITTAPITGTTSSSAIRPYCAERLKWEAAMGEVAVPAISDESTSIRGWPTKAGAGASWRRRRQGRGRCMRAGPTRARTVLQMNAEPAAMAIFIRPGVHVRDRRPSIASVAPRAWP